MSSLLPRYSCLWFAWILFFFFLFFLIFVFRVSLHLRCCLTLLLITSFLFVFHYPPRPEWRNPDGFCFTLDQVHDLLRKILADSSLSSQKLSIGPPVCTFRFQFFANSWFPRIYSIILPLYSLTFKYFVPNSRCVHSFYLSCSITRLVVCPSAWFLLIYSALFSVCCFWKWRFIYVATDTCQECERERYWVDFSVLVSAWRQAVRLRWRLDRWLDS